MRNLLPALLLILFACESGAVRLEDYCGRLAALVCEAQQRCDCFSYVSSDFCLSSVRAGCEYEVLEPVMEGSKAYDAAQAETCLDDLEGYLLSCNEEDVWPVSCDVVVVGQLEAGSACVHDDECVSGHWCWDWACAHMPVAGDDCINNYYCGYGFFCGNDGKCSSPRGDGEACPEGHYACSEGLFCNWQEQAGNYNGVCRPRRTKGDDCSNDHSSCSSGLFCSNRTGECTVLPEVGDDCSKTKWRCAGGARCDQGTCRALGADGEECNDGSMCRSGICRGNICAQPLSAACLL